MKTLNSFFSASKKLIALGGAAARRIRNSILILLISPFVLIIVTYFAGQTKASILSIILILVGGYSLFNLRRLLSVDAIGESLELLNVSGGEDRPGWRNKLIEKYLQFATIAFLFNLFLSLIIPMLPLEYNKEAMLYLPFGAILLLVLGSFVFPEMTRRILFLLCIVSIILLMSVSAVRLFPQVGYYLGWEKIMAGFVSSEEAHLAQAIEELRREQIETSLAEELKKVEEWQKQNPGKNLSPEMQEILDAVKSRMTLDEYKKKKAQEVVKAEARAKEAQKVAEANAEAEARAKADKVAQKAAEASKLSVVEAKEKATTDVIVVTEKDLRLIYPGAWGVYTAFMAKIPSGQYRVFLEKIETVRPIGYSLFIGGKKILAKDTLASNPVVLCPIIEISTGAEAWFQLYDRNGVINTLVLRFERL